MCLDKNGNGLCDSGGPSAVTAADGSATLTVPAADANKSPMLALVGTDTVDADHGPVTVAFSLQAPADKPAVVSPLSTLARTGNAQWARQAQARQRWLVAGRAPTCP